MGGETPKDQGKDVVVIPKIVIQIGKFLAPAILALLLAYFKVEAMGNTIDQQAKRIDELEKYQKTQDDSTSAVSNTVNVANEKYNGLVKNIDQSISMINQNVKDIKDEVKQLQVILFSKRNNEAK